MACFKTQVPHFTTGDFKAPRVFLEDAEYGRALDCLVKACSDFLILDSDDVSTARVLLGKRIVEPQPDWWFMGGRMRPGEKPEQWVQRLLKFMGGRMRPGEKPEESVRRLLKRELGLEVGPDALRLLGTHSYHWYRRQQAPVENGTCDIVAVFTLVVTPEQAEGIKLDPNEYGETRWYTVQEILEGEHFHPALRQAARDLLSRAAWDALQSAVKEGKDDATLAALAKSFVQSQ